MSVSQIEYSFCAPAKLNRSLRITGRRADGYHLLESVFCLIDLHDTLHIRLRDDGNIVLHHPQTDDFQKDLIYRAGRALQNFTNCFLGADIRIDKRIPMGGGLGGGSSDAATTLMALNHLWNTRCTREDLMKIGIQLGADVPFFLLGENAFVEGIGEILTPYPVKFAHYVVLYPKVFVSTAKIFSLYDLTEGKDNGIMPPFQGDITAFNDLQKIVLAEYPEVAKAYRFLNQYGTALMTGSGSCVFILLDDAQKAKAVVDAAKSDFSAFYTVGLNQHPHKALLD